MKSRPLKTRGVTRGFPVYRIEGELHRIEDEVVVEESLNLHLNGVHYRRLTASPTMRRELIYGHLYAQGVATPQEVLELRIEPPSVDVKLRGEVDVLRLRSMEAQLLAEAQGLKPPEMLMELRVEDGVEVEAERLLALMGEMERRCVLFKRTGGVHSALLSTPEGEVAAHVEDISRHSAIDKAVGSILLGGSEPRGMILLSTGRQTASMVLKAVGCGVPLIASRAAPSSSGIRAAEAAGITLICFLRGGRMNVYTHPWRVRELRGRSAWRGPPPGR